ncbi:MAG: hypothetical protein KAU23_04735, partial [Anaerolineales bacterium]|nr:hypothetical protein [Anaerolineales bacterium]
MKKSTWIIIGIVGGLIVIASAFSAGAIVGNILLPKPDMSWFSQSTQIVPSQGADETPEVDPSVNISSEELFNPFWETWEIVHDQFVDQPVDDTALMRGAISGMLDSL